jgi:hypothetical protein
MTQAFVKPGEETFQQPYLGTLLLSHRGSTAPRPGFLIVVVVILTGVLVLNIVLEPNFRLLYAGPIVLLVNAWCLYVWKRNRAKSITCYEHALTITDLRHQITILYSDITGVSFKAVNEHTNWVYIQTTILLDIMSLTHDPIAFKVVGSKKDADNIWQMVQLIMSKNGSVQMY